MSPQDTDTFPAARPPAAFNPLTALDDLVSTVSAARAGDGQRHINRRPGSHPARRAPGEFLRRPVCVCERSALDVQSLGPAAPAPSDRQPKPDTCRGRAELHAGQGSVPQRLHSITTLPPAAPPAGRHQIITSTRPIS